MLGMSVERADRAAAGAIWPTAASGCFGICGLTIEVHLVTAEDSFK